jgi:predicted nucleotidyltransferase
MPMSAVTEDVLGEITRRLVAELRPEQLFVFGSCAWGEPTPDSDLDLMVVVRDGQGPPRLLKERARRCLRDIVVPMDILIEPVGVFERRRRIHASLECQVAEQGRKLHG